MNLIKILPSTNINTKFSYVIHFHWECFFRLELLLFNFCEIEEFQRVREIIFECYSNPKRKVSFEWNRFGFAMLLAWLCFLALTTLVASTANSVFTNSFLVRFHRSVQNDVVHDIASRNGFENVGEVITFFGFYSLLRTEIEVPTVFQSAPKGYAANRKKWSESCRQVVWTCGASMLWSLNFILIISDVIIFHFIASIDSTRNVQSIVIRRLQSVNSNQNGSHILCWFRLYSTYFAIGIRI